jgi:hypothetical protein
VESRSLSREANATLAGRHCGAGAASELECEDAAFAEVDAEPLSALRSRAEQVMELMNRVEATTWWSSAMASS